ncbi:hypothetical protein [Erysipelothrix rhusiopathiae]|uniref:hypothetical protein n=1 Tax=Erysipelothrix rhusiopathiae TaxID=1648 RepID=UPI000F4305C4|nr:hypothetical protein [Erysipelothrix rhusiopathiae]AYV35305.1 hypothetical protein EEY85_08365 [Erysipelothrix rhusiopathiae]
MKRTWSALLVILASAIIYKFLLSVLPSSLVGLATTVWMVLMLVIGYFLAPLQKKNNRWVGKVVLSFVIICIFGYRLNLLSIPEFTSLLNAVGITGTFLDILLIYCGWAFFQV